MRGGGHHVQLNQIINWQVQSTLNWEVRRGMVMIVLWSLWQQWGLLSIYDHNHHHHVNDDNYLCGQFCNLKCTQVWRIAKRRAKTTITKRGIKKGYQTKWAKKRATQQSFGGYLCNVLLLRNFPFYFRNISLSPHVLQDFIFWRISLQCFTFTLYLLEDCNVGGERVHQLHASLDCKLYHHHSPSSSSSSLSSSFTYRHCHYIIRIILIVVMLHKSAGQNDN